MASPQPTAPALAAPPPLNAAAARERCVGVIHAKLRRAQLPLYVRWSAGIGREAEQAKGSQ